MFLLLGSKGEKAYLTSFFSWTSGEFHYSFWSTLSEPGKYLLKTRSGLVPTFFIAESQMQSATHYSAPLAIVSLFSPIINKKSRFYLVIKVIQIESRVAGHPALWKTLDCISPGSVGRLELSQFHFLTLLS